MRADRAEQIPLLGKLARRHLLEVQSHLGAGAGAHRALQLIGEFCGRIEPARGRPMQGAIHDGFELGRHLDVEGRHRWDGPRGTGEKCFVCTMFAKGARSCDEFPQDDGGCEDVGPAIHGSRHDLFGRCVAHLGRPAARQPGGAGECRSEVDDPRRTICADQDVFRAYVSMHDLERLAGCVSGRVGGVEAA